MYLKELDLGNEVKCCCGACEGTGIYKGYAEKEDLGVICSHCNGKGYYTIKLNDNVRLVKDETNGIVYEVVNGIIEDYLELFENLKRRDDVKYVMYGTGRFFSTSYLQEHGASEVDLVRYEDFLNGQLPLPMKEYTCPRQLSQTYGNAEFDNDCFKYCRALFSECKKMGTQECWNKFYQEAETIEEKQAVLKMLR